MQVIWFILSINMFILKEDDKEHHKELFQQFKADIFRGGINTDIRDEVLKSLSRAKDEVILAKHRNYDIGEE